jgi:hypothetical protein
MKPKGCKGKPTKVNRNLIKSPQVSAPKSKPAQWWLVIGRVVVKYWAIKFVVFNAAFFAHQLNFGTP